MDPTPHFKRKRMMTMIGAFSILFPMGVSHFWGNLAVYVSSSMYVHGISYSDIQSPWIMSCFITSGCIFFPLGAYLGDILGKKRIIITGIIIYNAGIFLSYFTLNASYFVFTAMFTLLWGSGTGLVYANCLEYALNWKETSIGLTDAMLGSSVNLGTVVINEFLTLYINPSNKVPDLRLGRMAFFSQVDIIERVAWAFLYLGMLSSITQLLGFCMLYESPLKHDNVAMTVNGYDSTQETTHVSNSSETKQVKTRVQNRFAKDAAEDKNHRLKTMLKSKVFYLLWFSVGMTSFTRLVTLNYYKQVGQTGITDDHFLTLAGTSSAFVMAGMRIICGITMDKIGVKNTFLMLFFLLSICGFSYSLTPQFDRWVYFITTILYLSWSGSLYFAYSTATILIFGHKNFALNYALICTSGLFINSCAPYLIGRVLVKFGWHGVFHLTGLTNFLGGIAIMKFL